MAAPLLAITKIGCDQFEGLRPLGLVLSGETAADARSETTPVLVAEPAVAQFAVSHEATNA
jgi:hypothetical protein